MSVTSYVSVLSVGLRYPATSTEVFLLLVAVALWAATVIFIANQTSKSDALTRTQKISWGLGALVFPLIALVLYFIMKPGRT